MLSQEKLHLSHLSILSETKENLHGKEYSHIILSVYSSCSRILRFHFLLQPPQAIFSPPPILCRLSSIPETSNPSSLKASSCSSVNSSKSSVIFGPVNHLRASI